VDPVAPTTLVFKTPLNPTDSTLEFTYLHESGHFLYDCALESDVVLWPDGRYRGALAGWDKGPEDEREEDCVPPEFWETLNAVSGEREEGDKR
jgi:hypothetical protein